MTASERSREHRIAEQIEARGVRDQRVIAAIRQVPREMFVPKNYRDLAYNDGPLPIGAGQTISQPYVVALMVEALGLSGTEKVLEIGAGSGYAAAVLAEVAEDVFAIERIGRLARQAKANLVAAGYPDVHTRHGDGTEGWVDEAPFDAILVSAGAPRVPKSLSRQLAIGGRIVVPIGRDPCAQNLVCVTRVGADEFEQESLGNVRFVPLIGKEGWEQEFDRRQWASPRIARWRR